MVELKLQGDDGPHSWYLKFVSEIHQMHSYKQYYHMQLMLEKFNGTIVCTLFDSGVIIWNGERWTRITGFQFENDEDASFFLLRWS